MPRPLGWTPGEGRYKGLGNLGDFTMGPMYTCADGSRVLFSSDCVGGGPPSGTALDQVQAEVAALQDAIFGTVGPYSTAGAGQPVGSSTNLGAWIQQNSGMLLIGAVVGLLLFRK